VKRTIAAGIIAVATVLPIVSQHSESTPRKLDGMNLLKACEGPPQGGGMAAKWGTPIPSEGNIDYAYCMGVVRGVSFWLLPKGCPDDVTLDQKVSVVSKYLKEHPEDLNMPDALLVSTALSKAFPCPTSHIK
jgi:hypothetical protein